MTVAVAQKAERQRDARFLRRSLTEAVLMDTDETREAAAGGRYVSNGQHCVACEEDELPDCRRAGIRFAAADRSTDTLPPTPLTTPWVPSAHPPLAYVQETEEHRDTRHTWTAQTPPVRVTSSSVLGGGATLFVAPRSLVFRMMCWRACFVLSCLDNLMLAGLRTTAPPTWLTLPKLPECGRVAVRHAAAGNYTDALAPIPLPHR